MFAPGSFVHFNCTRHLSSCLLLPTPCTAVRIICMKQKSLCALLKVFYCLLIVLQNNPKCLPRDHKVLCGLVPSLHFNLIPPSPSPTESKRLFYTSVSLLLSRIQGYCYHLPKFHIYALVYCIGFFFFFLAYFTLYNRLQFHPPR